MKARGYSKTTSSSSRTTTHLMDLSLQMQSPSPSQMPLVCPRVTQLAEQAHWPRVHLNPPLTRLAVASRTNTGVSVLPNILLTKIQRPVRAAGQTSQRNGVQLKGDLCFRFGALNPLFSDVIAIRCHYYQYCTLATDSRYS